MTKIYYELHWYLNTFTSTYAVSYLKVKTKINKKQEGNQTESSEDVLYTA